MEKYIVRKTEIEEMEGLSKTHFLNPSAQRINKSIGDLTGISSFGFHIIEVEPGKCPSEFHVHKFEDECIYILSGTAEVTIGEEVSQVEEGDFVGCRANGEPHKIQNTGSSILKCIVVGARLSHDVADYPNIKKRLFRNGSEPWNLVDIPNVSYPQAGKKA